MAACMDNADITEKNRQYYDLETGQRIKQIASANGSKYSKYCIECGVLIPEQRQLILKGCVTCADCQNVNEGIKP